MSATSTNSKTGKPFDVAIAGGGVIGGAIALELAREGLHVAVFDRQKPGQEASWASAGIISPAPENPGMIGCFTGLIFFVERGVVTFYKPTGILVEGHV